MAKPRTFQELIHWLEVGEGARWMKLAAVLLGVLVLSLKISHGQFRGATSEATLLQADVGRQLARGEGFTTSVNFPQTAAFMEVRGQRFDAARAYPELHHAPLYSIVIGLTLRLLPESTRESLFAQVPQPPDGFGADYLLLGLNVVMLWLAAVLTFDLARRLFDGRVAWLAVFALLLSVGVWRQTVAINGTALLMLLGVATFWIWTLVEKRREFDGGAAGPAAVQARVGMDGAWRRMRVVVFDRVFRGVARARGGGLRDDEFCWTSAMGSSGCDCARLCDRIRVRG